MKIPRQISGHEFSAILERYGYRITRQTGSHLRLTTNTNGEHHITIPTHKNLKIGTISGILTDIACHLKIDKSELIKSLFQ